VDFFNFRSRELFCEDVRLADVAQAVGTPTYVYSRQTIVHHYRRIEEAFAWAHPPSREDRSRFGGVPPLICYSVKVCSNLAVLKILALLGSGFDVVSGGEIHRVVKAGGDPAKIVFAGVGKTDSEIEYAAGLDILLFTVESEGELEAIERVASRLRAGDAGGKRVRVALRLNPDVEAHTHAYLSTGKRESKFGLEIERAHAVLARRGEFPHLDFVGVHVHIGSQITVVEPYVDALTQVARFVREEEKSGFRIETIDMGGGFGIFYKGGEARLAEEFSAAIRPVVEPLGRRFIMEPGRFIVGNAGLLLARVLYVKQSHDKTFVIVDAAMNDLIRPSLYQAEHRVWPTHPPFLPEEAEGRKLTRTDVVGPVCESGDFLALDRMLPEVRPGELLAIFSAGAYGMTMSSNYNSRMRAAEVLVEGNKFRVVRSRETLDDLTRLESC
jgi:diaminopimelate decarboxylase